MYLSVGLLKERNAEVGQLMGEKAALERELEKLKEQVSRVVDLWNVFLSLFYPLIVL